MTQTRRFQNADTDGVLGFMGPVLDVPPYDEARREIVDHPAHTGWRTVSVDENDQPTGFISVSYPYWNAVAIIDSLGVEESARRSGVGSKLVRDAEGWCAAQGARLICVQTATWNSGGVTFYERLGYSQRATFSHYLSGPDDLVWLDKLVGTT